jgi:hypothetical protein
MKKFTRRDFIKAIAIVSGVAGVGLTKLLSNPPLKGLGQQLSNQIFLPFTMTSTEEAGPPRDTPSPTSSAPTPTPERSTTPFPPPESSRVVHTSSAEAHNWNTSDLKYWNYVNQDAIDEMTDQGMIALTGTSSIADAYRSILPNYRPGEGIAVKVNFNNCTACNDESGQLDGIIEPVNALIRGLKAAGVQEQDIWIYDAIRRLPNRFVDGCSFGSVKFHDVGCRLPSGFSSSDPSATVNFNLPAGVPAPDQTIRITDVLINAKYVINIPIMRAHGCVGVTLAFKHHYGSINSPILLHKYCLSPFEYYHNDFSPFVDIYSNPNIAGKTVLTIGDGLFGHASSNTRPPRPWSIYNNGFPKSLFFSRDPVAIDCVMADIINAEHAVPDASYRYLQIAQDKGLGLYEHGNPLGSGYSNLDYVKLDL